MDLDTVEETLNYPCVCVSVYRSICTSLSTAFSSAKSGRELRNTVQEKQSIAN